MAIAATATPYLTPELLSQFPLGISWSSIPAPNSTSAQNYAALQEICAIATGRADTAGNNVLRATTQPEQLIGPDFRVTIQPNGTCRLLLSQRPILQVTQIQVACAATFPPQWVTVTTGLWRVEKPPLLVTGSSVANDAGTGGQAV